MIISFTGTQKGMTDKQKYVFESILYSIHNIELHHGDCIGADKEACQLARTMGYKICCHPPFDGAKRAYMTYDYIYAQAPYLQRNKSIVNCADLLIAVPQSAKEELRSGTWSTVRYAKGQNVSVYVISPDGTVRISGANVLHVKKEDFIVGSVSIVDKSQIGNLEL